MIGIRQGAPFVIAHLKAVLIHLCGEMGGAFQVAELDLMQGVFGMYIYREAYFEQLLCLMPVKHGGEIKPGAVLEQGNILGQHRSMEPAGDFYNSCQRAGCHHFYDCFIIQRYRIIRIEGFYIPSVIVGRHILIHSKGVEPAVSQLCLSLFIVQGDDLAIFVKDSAQLCIFQKCFCCSHIRGIRL